MALAVREGWRRRGFDIVFGTDTRAGCRFDAALIVAIVLVTMLDSVAALHARCGSLLRAAECVFTGLSPSSTHCTSWC